MLPSAAAPHVHLILHTLSPKALAICPLPLNFSAMHSLCDPNAAFSDVNYSFLFFAPRLSKEYFCTQQVITASEEKTSKRPERVEAKRIFFEQSTLQNECESPFLKNCQALSVANRKKKFKWKNQMDILAMFLWFEGLFNSKECSLNPQEYCHAFSKIG